jgi:hypothetical protein
MQSLTELRRTCSRFHLDVLEQAMLSRGISHRATVAWRRPRTDRDAIGAIPTRRIACTPTRPQSPPTERQAR